MQPRLSFWALLLLISAMVIAYVYRANIREYYSGVKQEYSVDTSKSHVDSSKKKLDLDSLIKIRDSILIELVKKDAYYIQLDTILSQGENHSITSDSVRHLYDSIRTAKMNAVMEKHNYFSSKGHDVKSDTMRMDDNRTMVVIGHINDGRCMCKYIRSVEVVTDEDVGKSKSNTKHPDNFLEE
jgi:hypothetical protein